MHRLKRIRLQFLGQIIAHSMQPLMPLWRNLRSIKVPFMKIDLSKWEVDLSKVIAYPSVPVCYILSVFVIFVSMDIYAD
jgi:hypothetical protein